MTKHALNNPHCILCQYITLNITNICGIILPLYKIDQLMTKPSIFTNEASIFNFLELIQLYWLLYMGVSVSNYVATNFLSYKYGFAMWHDWMISQLCHCILSWQNKQMALSSLMFFSQKSVYLKKNMVCFKIIFFRFQFVFFMVTDLEVHEETVQLSLTGSLIKVLTTSLQYDSHKSDPKQMVWLV